MSATAQRDSALERANKRRLAGKEFRDHLKALGYYESRREVSRILAEEPERLATMRVCDFLEALPGMGDSRIRALLWPHIWPLKCCGELTQAQRSRLAGDLEKAAVHWRIRWGRAMPK